MKIKSFFVAVFAVMSFGLSAQTLMSADDAIRTLETEVTSLEHDLNFQTVTSQDGVGAATTEVTYDLDVSIKFRMAKLVLENIYESKDAASALETTRDMIEPYSTTEMGPQAMQALGYVEDLITVQ